MAIEKNKKKELMPARLKRAKKRLEELSHNFIRKRDSNTVLPMEGYGGYCIDCGRLATGQHFQCGHWEPSSTGGALLRYHPHNMNGQASGCNMWARQESVKIAYTLKMLEKYGVERVNKLRQLKNKTIKADIIFYERLIELYEAGDEKAIVDFLESYL